MSALFQPLTLLGLTLPNRVVMAPMSRYFSPGGVPTQASADYYARRARHGVGLILTEATLIPHKASNGYKDVPRVDSPEAQAGWRRVVDAVHAEGGRIGMQLWHVGSIRRRGQEPLPEVPGFAPSAVSHPYHRDEELPHAMSAQDIEDVIGAYASAAEIACELGFDTLEIHGAHGYLLDQFLWERTNCREDAYGGAELWDRLRLPLEVTRAVRAVMPAAMPLLYRFSQWKLGAYREQMAKTPEELSAWLVPLAEAGVDVFHCSTRKWQVPEFDESPLTLAGWTKALTGKPSIAVGSVGLDQEMLKTNTGWGAEVEGTDEIAERVLQGEFDLVGVGRALLSDPEWVEKVREGRFGDIRAYHPDHVDTLY